MTQPRFKAGDRVTHPARPQWGVGVVLDASLTTEQGRTGQRLSIRFDRAGRKTLSTLFVNLSPAPTGDHQSQPASAIDLGERPAPTGDSLETLERLPGEATDPLLPLGVRLHATLNLYRYTDQGGSLLDWAAVRLGVSDPLSLHTRHELEARFALFSRHRDDNMRQLTLQAVRESPQTLQRAIAEADPAAQRAVRRLDIRR